MIFLFIKIYIYLTYRCILIFENCRIAVSPYPYRCIGQPYRCNLGGRNNGMLSLFLLFLFFVFLRSNTCINQHPFLWILVSYMLFYNQVLETIPCRMGATDQKIGIVSFLLCTMFLKSHTAIYSRKQNSSELYFLQ
jgi:hypothetical protein